MNKKTISIKILPDNILLKEDLEDKISTISLANLLRKNKINISFPCGGTGVCGKCKVKFESGIPESTSDEKRLFNSDEIKSGYRLACQTELKNDCEIFIPSTSKKNAIDTLLSKYEHKQQIKPMVKKLFLKLIPSHLENLKSDADIVGATLYNLTGKTYRSTLQYLQKLPVVLRKQNYQVTVTVSNDEILDIEVGDTSKDLFGLAVDIGTTTLTCSVVNLISSETIGTITDENPQSDFGHDLISRIAHGSKSKENLKRLQEMVIGKINELILEICKGNNISPLSIFSAVMAGNTVMNHLLLGIDPYSVSVAPYTSVVKNLPLLSANQLNLKMNPFAEVFMLPNLGGFVGGDITGDLLVTESINKNRNYLLIDIGTNCELVIHKDGKYMTASSPAGPALEGAMIKNGMRAESGAITDIICINNDIEYLTVGNEKPIGICGSGLFHIIDFLVQKGVVDSRGKLLKPKNIENIHNKDVFKNRIKTDENGVMYFVLQNSDEENNEIVLTQKDIRQFQLAKSAIVAAWRVLCENIKINYNEIEQVFIAGAFGNYIRPEAVLSLGLVPNLSLDKIKYIGDAALFGSKMVLLNNDNIEKFKNILNKIKYIELSGRVDFQEFYINDLGKV
ncbi:MAG: ASKHA domain-containing protein [Candidatus Marinimicrobia bacterium]|nr:ASKHA domain-containing protein [Candidatus Neomarinimicrobiota bacterium]